MSATFPTVEVALRKELARALRAGHPWVFREALRPGAGIASGAPVLVRGRDRRPLVWGFWDAAGPIAVRVLGPAPARDPGTLVRERLIAALARRLARLDLRRTNAWRWVHGEGDGLPGIHVDLYAGVAAVRYDGQGARAFYSDLAEQLRGSSGPLRVKRIVDRDERKGSGTIEVRENEIRFTVDLGASHKGGLFLDQRENREEVRRLSSGKRMLDLFGYTGGFSLYAAAGGAVRTDMVDIARPAVEAARRNFALNGFPADRAGFFAADAFEFLAAAARRGSRWDIVVCDPPSFAPSERALPAARRGYRRLHQLAAAVVAPGGRLCLSSCSSHFGRGEFMASIEDGVAQAGRRFALETLRGAGFDHPVPAAFPEGAYLKFAVGRVD